MARTVRHAKLDSRTARANTKLLKRGRQPHWQELAPRVHLGYSAGKATSLADGYCDGISEAATNIGLSAWGSPTIMTIATA
jgi:hypothetical protein